MRKIPLNVSSICNNLPPHKAKPLTSQYSGIQHLAGESLIYPIRVIPIFSSSFTG